MIVTAALIYTFSAYLLMAIITKTESNYFYEKKAVFLIIHPFFVSVSKHRKILGKFIPNLGL